MTFNPIRRLHCHVMTTCSADFTNVVYNEWYMHTVKLKDAHLGVLQFAHKEKDEIEAMHHLITS